MTLYDPTGGHDAYLAGIQDRMQRAIAHAEDETGRPCRWSDSHIDNTAPESEVSPTDKPQRKDIQ